MNKTKKMTRDISLSTLISTLVAIAVTWATPSGSQDSATNHC